MAKKSTALLPIYLFVGNDRLKRDALVNRMQKRVGELGDIALNQTRFSAAEDVAPEQVVASCVTLPFLSEKRLVMVTDIEAADKELLTALSKYVESPSATTVLVITGDKLSKASKLYKNISAAFPEAVFSCEQKTRKNDVDGFIRKLAASSNVSIDANAAARLRELIGNSTVALDAEVTKLVGYVAAQSRNSISVADVNMMVSRREQPKPWDLTDPLSRRDARKCFNVLSEMSDRDKPFGLMSMCVKRIRELLVTKSVERRPTSAPLYKVLGGRNEYAYRNHMEFSRNFTEEELVDILDKAADYEAMMKSGYDPQGCFELWLVGVCTGTWGMA